MTMATFVVLTRLTPMAVKSPADLKKLERMVNDRIRKDCPQVKWVANYAILGPCDYLDIFDAPDEATAAKVVMIIRSLGHATTETWTALPWERRPGLRGGMAQRPDDHHHLRRRGLVGGVEDVEVVAGAEDRVVGDPFHLRAVLADAVVAHSFRLLEIGRRFHCHRGQPGQQPDRP